MSNRKKKRKTLNKERNMNSLIMSNDEYSQIYGMVGKASVGQRREMHLCNTRQRSPGGRKRIEEARKGLIGIVHVHDRQ